MMYKIIWSEPAKNDYWQNIDYLLENWTEIVTVKFIEAVERNLLIIAKDPKTFALTEYREIRSVPITKQITLFYRIVDHNIVQLVRFWNNYQDPTKLKF